MSSPIYVLGGWQSDFAERAPDGSLFELLGPACRGALADSELSASDIEVAHVGNLAGELFTGQAHLGAMLVSVDQAFEAMPTTRHEAACASGSVAVLAAMADISAGNYDLALVAGVEVMRNVAGQEAGKLLECAAWVGREVVDEPYPWPRQFADVAEVYERRFGLEHDSLGRIGEINFANARLNPLAQTRTWDVDTLDFGENNETNPLVAGMLRKNDCGRITDGAAAVILASPRYAESWADRHNRPLNSIARISGWGHRTGPLLLRDKLNKETEPYVFPHLRQALEDCTRRANLADPTDLDAIEVHDCTTLTEYVILDHLGIASPGKPHELIEDGVIELDGSLPTNASGGLMALGHPVGATGVRMLLDATRQVTQKAGDYQVDRAQRVGTCNVGGSFTSVACFVVETGDL